MNGRDRARFHTAPSRMRKRDVPAVWDLFALDDRAKGQADDDDASSVTSSISRAPSIVSLPSTSEAPPMDAMHGGPLPFVERGGSWPRVRKQRTSEMGSSMSLFEVAEALGAGETSTEDDLSSHLAQLVAQEEAEMSVAPESANVSVDSFVDSVFHGIAPGIQTHALASVEALQPHGSKATTDALASADVSPILGAAPASAAPSASRPARAHTANELALLEALKADHAANAAAGESMGGARHGMSSSPTFSTCVGALDGAVDAHGRGADTELNESDDVFAMLQMELPSTLRGAHALGGGPPDGMGYYGSDGFAAGPASPTGELAPHYAFPEDAHYPYALGDGEHGAADGDDGYGGYGLPYDPSSFGGRGYGGYDPMYDGGAGGHAPGGEDADAFNPEQLAGQFANALGVPLDTFAHGSHPASRAPTVRGPAKSRGRSQQGGGRPSARGSFPPPQPPLPGATGGYPGAPPPPPHGVPSPPHHSKAYPTNGPPLPHAMLPYEGPPPSTHLDAEALNRIPKAAIQPLGPVTVPHPAAMGHAQLPPPGHHPHHPHAPPPPPEHYTQPHHAPPHHVPPHHVPPHHGGARPPTMQAGAYPPSTTARHGASALAGPTGGVAGRNGAERKEWTLSEDDIIRESVAAHGCKWRRIAGLLPGRSDDAVRNRWNRLKEIGVAESATPAPGAAAADAACAGGADGMAADGTAAAATTTVAAGGAASDASQLPLPAGMPPVLSKAAAKASSASASAKPDKDRPERVSWSKAEDETILAGVHELGHKWNRIAERLPGRTDHAIRNRFHRLQSLLEDRQRQQQRTLAPNMPLPVPMGHAVPPTAQQLAGVPAANMSLLTAGVESPRGGSGYETPVGASEAATSPAAQTKLSPAAPTKIEVPA